MTLPEKVSLLFRAAEKASSRPQFLGYLFALCSGRRRLDRAGLAATLGCSEETVVRMSLCLRPGNGERNFGSDVDAIAAKFGVDSYLLAKVIREAQALEAFQDASAQGMLLAAREDEDESWQLETHDHQ